MLSRHKAKTYTPSLSDDFLNFRVYGTPITIQFYGRNHKLSPEKTRLCLRQAQDASHAHLDAGLDDTPVGTHALSYSAGTSSESVHLELSPKPQLTWGTWGQIVDSLDIVQATVEYEELYFVILWELSPGSYRTDGVGKMWETWR